MAKAVFTTRVSPTYDDLPENYYHFPKQYLRRVEQVVGDFIVYYEPSRTGDKSLSRHGRMVYFATAQVLQIREDLQNNGHYYADISNYLEFSRPVPFRDGDYFYEKQLKGEGGETKTGMFQNAVRIIPDDEYELIAQAGFSSIFSGDKSMKEESKISGLHEEQQEFQRPIIERVTKRPFRDVAFRENVQTAYSATCAMTGLHLINGGGRCEIEAAHIRPVGDGHNGPDSIRNGIALSRTVHWMFDRGHLSISNDHKILIAKKYVPEPIQNLLNTNSHIMLPEEITERPHQVFLEYHQDCIFKG